MVGSLSFAAQQQSVACHPGSPAIGQRRGRRPPPPLAGAPQRPASQQNNHKQRNILLQAAASPVSLGAEGSNSSPQSGLLEAKQRLLNQVAGTERGGEAQTLQRGLVEEAQVAVEAFTGGAELDYGLLEGKWRLRYTTARDVLPLVSPQRLPAPLQVGRIYQQFSCLEEGRVQNIIEATLPPPPLPLLAGADLAVTLVVEAGYEARTARSIALSFREAGFRDVVPSPALQNLLASPLLPRGWWNQQLLLALTQLSGSVPLATRPPGLTSGQRTPASGLNYMLTYLDEDMLIGRAQGNGGTFIFSREAEQGGEGGKAAAAQW